MDRTRRIAIALVIAAVAAATTYALWPKTQRGVITLPPIGAKR